MDTYSTEGTFDRILFRNIMGSNDEKSEDSYDISKGFWFDPSNL